MKQLREVQIRDIVFLDIETARVVDELEIDTPLYESWKYKMERAADEKEFDLFESYKDKAALYAEFARIVCITVGRVKDGRIVLKTYDNEDEKVLLEQFTRDLSMVTNSKKKTRLCGHSVINFDIPFIFKRCMVQQVMPNELIDVGGLKPWEVTALDTKNLWKSSGYYNASLINVCVALGVESPKSDITGAEVGDVFWGQMEGGVPRIVKYCERDVVSLINCVLVMRFEDQIHDIEVHEVTDPEPENVMQRIARTGIITDEDAEELKEKASGMSYPEKERTIKIVKAALAQHKQELSQELELDLLK